MSELRGFVEAKPVVARKEHRCDLCGHQIPVGARYWRTYDEQAMIDRREHGNCLDFEKRPELPEGFNSNRGRRGK